MAGIYIEIIGNASSFKKSLDEAVVSTNRANSHLAKLGKAAGLAGGVLVAGLAVGLDKSMKAAVVLEASTARLDQAFKNAHLAVKPYQAQLDKVESASRKLGFTDDDVRGSLGSLITATHNVHKSMLDLTVAENLARFKHESLEAATKTLTMAMAGSQRAAKQLGIDVPKVTTAEDALKRAHVDTSTAAGKLEEAHAKLIDRQRTAALVIAEVDKRTHGMGDAFAGTAAGSMEVFHAQTQHLEEVLGKTLLPVIVDVMTGLAKFADWMGSTGAPAIKKAAEDIATYFTGIYDSVKSVVDGVTSFFDKLPGRLWTAFSTPWLTAYAGLKGAFVDVKDWARDRVTDVVDFFGGMADRIWKGFAGAWATTYSNITGAFDDVKNFARGLVGDVAHFFSALPGKIVDAISSAMGDLLAGIKDLFSWKKIVGWIKDALLGGSPSKPLMDVGMWMVDSIAKGVGSAEGLLKDAVENIAKKYVLPLFGTSGSAVPGTVAGPHGTVVGGGGLTSGNQALGQKMAAGYGWGSGAEWAALNAVAMRESGWSNTVWGSGVHTVQDLGGAEAAYGIAQAKPAGKYPFAGQPGGGSSASAQIGWMLSYIKGRYGDPVRAWAHEQAVGWYGQGGVFTQPTIIGVGERGPEAVVPLGRGGMGGVTVNVTVNGALMGSTVPEVADTIRRELLRTNRRNTGGLGFG